MCGVVYRPPLPASCPADAERGSRGSGRRPSSAAQRVPPAAAPKLPHLVLDVDGVQDARHLVGVPQVKQRLVCSSEGQRGQQGQR